MSDSRQVLVTGTVTFEDGRQPLLLDRAGPPGGGDASSTGDPTLYEFPGLYITVLAGGREHNERTVVSQEGRFGFRAPVPRDLDKVDIRVHRKGHPDVNLEGLAIMTGVEPVGDLVDVGAVVVPRAVEGEG